MSQPKTLELANTGDDHAADTAPTRIGRYRVIKQIGTGGMGIVYAAYDPELDRKVAVKILRGRATVEACARLRQEAQTMAKLCHPNVVRVFDVGTLDGHVFVAMDYVSGCTLREWLEHEPRRWRGIVAMFVQAGEGLSAAHAAHVVHRDFKPDNVLVGKDGRVRVVDFGLAKSAPEDHASSSSSGLAYRSMVIPRTWGQAVHPVTESGVIMGTLPYMSPEQHASEDLDPRSDQFSFCAALYEALYGEKPYEAHDRLDLVAQVTSGNVRPPPINAAVPGWLRRVLLRGLDPDPAARWPSMRALLQELASAPRRARVWSTYVPAVAAMLIALTWGAVSLPQALGQIWTFMLGALFGLAGSLCVARLRVTPDDSGPVDDRAPATSSAG